MLKELKEKFEANFDEDGDPIGMVKHYKLNAKLQTLQDILKLISSFEKLRLYRSKSCQLLLRRIKKEIEG